MSFKSIACLATLVALTATTASAQTITVDLQRDGSGNAVLDANGDWVWEVTYNTDADGGAASVEFGASFTDSDLISGNVTVTGEGNGDIEVATAGRPVFGWESLTVGENGAFAEGLQVDPSQGTNGQAFYAHGTAVLSGTSSVLLGTFTTEGPSSGAGGSLTSSIAIQGAYDSLGAAGGNLAYIGESGGFYTTSDTASATATVGDINLDGVVNGSDLSALGIAFDPLGNNNNNWSTGDFNGDGLVNGADLSALGIGFDPLGNSTNKPAPISSATPEPTSVALAALLAGVSLGFRRRK